MNYLEVHHEFRILVLEGVVAMRGRDKDSLHPIFDESLDVFSGQVFEQSLISCLADAFSAAVFLDTQYPEIYRRPSQDIGRGSGYLL
jgi:hypothetical protein